MKGRRDTVVYVPIDVADYIDEPDEALDTEDTIYVRDQLAEAKRCLLRPERNAAEAILHIENALAVAERAVPYVQLSIIREIRR